MSSKRAIAKRKRVRLKNGEILELTEPMYAFALTFARTNNEQEARKAAEYSEKGFRNNRKKIMERIQPLLFQIQQETEQRVVMDKARVVEEISHIALANPLDYLHDDGKPKSLRELTREQAAAIAQFEVTRDKKGKVTTSYKLHNKMQALELGGKHLGLFDARLIMQGRVEHIHKHKHSAIDLAKVPRDRLLEWEREMRDEAERQGATIDNTTGEVQ